MINVELFREVISMSFNRFRHQKSVFIILLFGSLMCLALILSCSNGNHRDSANCLNFVNSFEGGALYLTPNSIYPVLNLSGNWYEMGRQYGHLLQHQLRDFHDDISSDLTVRGMSYAAQLESAREFYQLYSPHIHQIMDGMTQTSGLSKDEVLVLNAGMMLLSGVILQGSPPSVCSGIAAWDTYTPDNTLVFGRNWDISRAEMVRYMKYLGVAVFHPRDGYAVANIHPIGNLYLETGMNETGLFLELNNGEQSDNGFNPSAEDTASVLFRVLASSATIDDAYAMLEATPADLAYIIQLADASRAVSIERATFGCRLREGKYLGLLAATNNFVPPYPSEWDGLVNPPPDATQDPRLENLWNLANSPAFKGNLDVYGMMRLMEIDIQQGGAVHDGTVVQVIASPENKTIWLRGLDYSDWEKVDLGFLFSRH